ncbi:MAG: class I SAM-dependent methyltransferase, partial [Candidatus Brocadiaceae bacterium]
TYKGLSSVIMALNSRHATVYCIDPLDGRGDTASSGYEQVDLRPIVRANHVRYGVRNCAVIATTSREARAGWKRRIDLLFVDGSHDYADVSFDVNEWGVLVKPGAHMIMDDATPISSKPGVIRAAREALASPRWLKVEEAGACLVLRRQRDDQQGGSSR